MNHWPLCAQVGALHGMIIGFAFGVLQTSTTPMSPADLGWMLVLFAALAALVSLFLLAVLRRYTLRSVLWTTLANALLVAMVVIAALSAVGPHSWSPLLGVLLGLALGALTGAALCRLCDQRTPSSLTGRANR